VRENPTSQHGGIGIARCRLSDSFVSDAAARQDLARPFEQRVLFAGEATNTFDFSTAQGAHGSGVRAAEEVIAGLLPGFSGRLELEPN
jgi:hypothetical protein